MKDTPPAIERKFRAMLMKRSGEERLKMGCSMHATALAFARASLLQKRPGAHPAELKRSLFFRMYGADFDPEQRKRIASAFLKSAKHPSATRARVRGGLKPRKSQSQAQVAEHSARCGSRQPGKRRK
ncbi:MAG TPA: hypothetical protein VNN13_03235 [Methylomirabilota bacterium]|nr:hypothetical protein [Methylomirabilota bacterium]